MRHQPTPRTSQEQEKLILNNDFMTKVVGAVTTSTNDHERKDKKH